MKPSILAIVLLSFSILIPNLLSSAQEHQEFEILLGQLQTEQDTDGAAEKLLKLGVRPTTPNTGHATGVSVIWPFRLVDPPGVPTTRAQTS
jgi:hypothetical protein